MTKLRRELWGALRALETKKSDPGRRRRILEACVAWLNLDDVNGGQTASLREQASVELEALDREQTSSPRGSGALLDHQRDAWLYSVAIQERNEKPAPYGPVPAATPRTSHRRSAEVIHGRR
jgi:hypothetical protein